MEYFSVRNGDGSFTENVPHYTIAEVATETGFHRQTIRNRMPEMSTQLFKNRHYINQLDLDRLRAESPRSQHRVGEVGVIQKIADML